MPNKVKKGETALSGTEEYFRVWIFEKVDYERRISGRGHSIIVWDPSKDNAPSYWARENTTSNEDTDVPAGYVVRVIEAWVKFI